MPYETITLERDGALATITLNRPERLNACSLQMADELSDALDAVADARALLLTGAGRAFCSGADLQGRGDRGEESPGQGSYRALTEHYNPLMLKLARVAAPVVVAVNGAAAGVGCSIALAGDIVIAGRSAYFLQAFVNIGLVPDGGASWMLPRLAGRAKAAGMMLLGERVPADEAERWGLIWRAIADDVLLETARATAERLAAGPTLALATMKRNLEMALQADYATALQREAEGQRQAGDSADAREGALAFLEKRKASFSGR